MTEAIFWGVAGYFLGCLIELTLKKLKGGAVDEIS